MEFVKLGKSGQVSVPRAILRRLGIEGETVLLVEETPDGGILLRPAGIYPLEIYGDRRVEEFLAEDELSKEERDSIARRRPE